MVDVSSRLSITCCNGILTTRYRFGGHVENGRLRARFSNGGAVLMRGRTHFRMHEASL
jgi:hypothetical protein